MAEAELLLLRHGVAEPRGTVEESLRALTPVGRERTRRVCQRARQLGLGAATLISSPLVRARQTGELALEAGLAETLTCSDALAPGADPWPLLRDWWSGDRPATSATNRLVLVGHEPDLSLLACRLIGAPPGALALKKAGIAVLAWPLVAPFPDTAPPAELRLLLSPRALDAI
ncbi:MAG: phosphohistidine phosphatase SixA [Cyanobacteria bacterium K_Offshore_surface_m2_239]|nr:phosphohistidine phosphatase SixA [Cyanobacteria bacterium K_Offshore_surface_m2_239]